MKWHLVIAVTAVTLLALLWFGQNQNDQGTAGQPVLYYTKGLVKQFDGTPYGSYGLYRIVGFNGQPELIASDSGNSYLPPPLARSQYIATRPHNYNSSADLQDFPRFTIGILADGQRAVIDSEYAVDVGLLSKVVSSDDRYLVTSLIECAEMMEDGPCSSTPIVKLYDYQSGKIYTYDRETLDNQDLLGLRAIPVFLSDESLLIDIEGQQERSVQYYYVINLSTGKVELAYSNTNQPEINYEVIKAVDDQTVLARRWAMSPEALADAIVNFNFVDNSVTIIDQFTDSDRLTYDFPITSSGYLFTPEYNQGLKYRDFATHTTKTLVDRGVAQFVTVDGRYAVMFEPDTDSGGYGSGQLVWWDFQNNKSRVVYDQRFGSGLTTNINYNPTPALKVGDSIYGFVSLEYIGSLVFKSGLGF